MVYRWGLGEGFCLVSGTRQTQPDESAVARVTGSIPGWRRSICIGSALSKSGERFCVFLSAHPNVSKKPPRVILLDPKGKVIASTRKRVVIRPTL